MIHEGSRYQDAAVVQVTLRNGTYRWAVLGQRYFVAQTVQYRYRTAVVGDRFDLMAAAEYGDPDQWWLIARANPEIFYPDEIPPGVLIRIPDAVPLR